MSRAGLAGLALLGGALGLVFFLLTRGLPDDAQAAARDARTALTSARNILESERKRLDEVVSRDAAFLGPRPEIAASRAALDAIGQRLDALEQRADGDLKALVDHDRHGDADQVLAVAAEVQSAAVAAVADASAPVATAEHLLGYKQNHQTLVSQARAQLAEAEQLGGDAALTALVAQAGAQYPEAAPKLQARVDALRQSAAAVIATSAQLDAALEESPVDFVKTGKLAEAVINGGQGLTTTRADIVTDVGTLAKSIDKILIDMRRTGNTCEHKYRVVEGGLGREEPWQTVSCALYAEHEDHLGMTLYSKPEGQLDSEAVRIASPPGYTYVGNPRYGRWESNSSGRFWVFYGQYSLMRDMLWGVGGYRPVYETGYRSYRTSVTSKKPWYGSSNEYGSKGSVTRTKYAGSSFYTAQRERERYAGSRYQKTNSGRQSGGGYQGSRYQSGSGGGSRSYRSGGSRSSPVRRTSFGGGGK
ncbi:MAG: hypothetical protein R3F60_19725 [bacterium]